MVSHFIRPGVPRRQATLSLIGNTAEEMRNKEGKEEKNMDKAKKRSHRCRMSPNVPY